MTQKKILKRYMTVYTLAFAGVCLLVLAWFIAGGKTLVYNGDGWRQHYKALIYYGRYLRDIVKNLFAGNGLVIPQWEFALGEGNDLITTLHYYVIGDPFAFGAIFVPTKYMYIFFAAMVILRLYCIGLSFSALCFETGQQSISGILAGSLTYVFCLWCLWNLARHPYFLNPLIYFPLLILGFERMRKNKRPTVFILAVCLAVLSNFYFLYVLGLLTVFYIAVRILYCYHGKMKEGLRLLRRAIAAALLGAGMGAVLLFPVAYTFLRDPRFEADSASHLLYPLRYYSNLLSILLGTSHYYWLCLGIAIPAVYAALLLFFKRREHGFLKILFLLCLVFTVFPFFGQMFNGFSYISNRWSWAFVLLFAYNLTIQWPRLMHLTKREGIYLLICTAVLFLLCCVATYSRGVKMFVTLGVGALFVILLLLFSAHERTGGKRKGSAVTAVFFIVLCIGMNAYAFYDSAQENYISEMVSVEEIKTDFFQNDGSAAALVFAAENSAADTRYSGEKLVANANMQNGISSTQYFWSLSNADIAQYRRALTLREHKIQAYGGYDSRAGLLSLAGVGYYIAPTGSRIDKPFTFSYLYTVDVKDGSLWNKKEQAEEEENRDLRAVYDVYENPYALPYGYAYSTYLAREAWANLSSPAKEQAMLRTVVLDDAAMGIAEEKATETAVDISYQLLADSADVTVQKDAFVVTKKNASVTLAVDGNAGTELFLELQGFSLEPTPVYDLYFGDAALDPQGLYGEDAWTELSKEDQARIYNAKKYWRDSGQYNMNVNTDTGGGAGFELYTPEYSYYSGQHNFTLHLGHQTEATHKITIQFPTPGVYRFDNIRVIEQETDTYIETVRALAENGLQEITFDTNTVRGRITAAETEVLCMSIPYSTGWRAYVDGEETKTFRANVKNIGVLLTPGEHKVEFRYHTPLLTAGAICSLISVAIFIAVIRYNGKRRKKKAV